MTMKIILFFLVLLIFSFHSLYAQERKNMFYIGVSPVAYKGDLSASYSDFNFAFSAGLKFNRNKRLNGQLNLTVGKISGQTMDKFFYKIPDDSTVKPVNYVKTPFFAVDYSLQYNFIKKKNFIFFLGQGVGIMNYTPKDEYGKALTEKSSSRNADESLTSIAICMPSRIGIIGLFDNGIGLGINAGFLNTFTDYLDNISELGKKQGNDNILTYNFLVYFPLGHKSE